jgi:hypothetical protein
MATSQYFRVRYYGVGFLLLSLGRTGNPYIVRRQYLRILGPVGQILDELLKVFQVVADI